jgi:hypothetical protein
MTRGRAHRAPHSPRRPHVLARDLASACEHWLARHEREQDRQAEVIAERLVERPAQQGVLNGNMPPAQAGPDHAD